jgi:hypothetical protein
MSIFSPLSDTKLTIEVSSNQLMDAEVLDAVQTLLSALRHRAVRFEAEAKAEFEKHAPPPGPRMPPLF